MTLAEQREGNMTQAAGAENVQALRGARDAKESHRDAYHYQDRYGAIMTDDQFEANNKAQDAFDAKIAASRGDIATARAGLNTAEQASRDDIAQQALLAQQDLQSQYDTAYGELRDINLGPSPNGTVMPTWDEWIQGNTNTIQIDGDATYVMDSSNYAKFVDKIHQFNKDNEEDISMWGTDTGVKIETHGYGAEWHESLGGYQAELKNKFDNEMSTAQAQIDAAQLAYDDAQSQLNSAYGALDVQYQSGQDTITSQVDAANMDLDGQMAIARGNLESATASLNAVVSERNKMLKSVRDKYSERINRMREGVMGISTGTQENGENQE